MKSYAIAILLIITNYIFAYDLLDIWLTTTSDSCIVYLTPEVDNLKTSWGLDFTACVNAVNSHGIDNVPILVAADSTSESAMCIIRYDSLPSPAEDSTVAINDLGGIFGDISSFTIRINKNKFNPAIHDINKVLKHELTHALGLKDLTSDTSALMYYDTVVGTATGLTNDEINGIKNVYEPPVIANVSTLSGNIKYVSPNKIEVMPGDSLVIDVQCPFMLAHNSVTPPPLIPESFMNSDNLADTLAYAVVDTNLYRYKISTSHIKQEYSNYFKGFVKRNSLLHDLSNYMLEHSSLTMLCIDVKPNVVLWRSSNKMEYSLDNTNIFNATCTDAYGNDYPYMDEVYGPIKFYYKEVGTNDEYTLIPSDEPPVKGKEATPYTCTWDKGDLKGDYIVKATAFYYENAESTEVLTWSDSLTIRLLDGFECEITEPKPYNVEAIDFEKFVDIKGLFYHDGTVDLDSVYKNYSYVDMQFYYDFCNDCKYYWKSLQLPYLPGTPAKEESGNIAIFKLKDDSSQGSEKDIKSVYVDEVTWCEPLRNDTLFVDDDNLYAIKPGLYPIYARLIDARENPTYYSGDSLLFMKPSWKLKLQGDFWYQYGFQYGVPYKEKTIYAPEEEIKLYQWRPFIERTIGTTYFNVSSEGINIADFSYDGINGYDQFIKEKYDLSTNLTLPDTFLVSTASPAEWVRTGYETPGFYTITATEYDPVAGCNAIQRKEIQIPPLYITAEKGYEGDEWPTDLWPRGAEYEDMENEDNWIIANCNFTYALGSKSIASYYDSAEEKGRMELTHPGVTINRPYNTEFQFAIGLKKEYDQLTQEYNFEKLLANYSIALEIGGVEEIIKTATVNEWNEYDAMNQWAGDGNDSIHYAVKFTKPLGGRVGMGTEVKVKLITEGIPEYYKDSLKQTVLYDEICICYTRKVCPEGPAMVTGYYKNVKCNDFVEISFDPPSNPIYVPEGYIIYRNGVKAGETTSTTFKDYDIQSNRTYKYTVTAKYTGLDYDESSMLDCSVTVSTGDITYPRPRNVVLTQGGGYEYNTVYLNWTEPVYPDSVNEYNIYRNDILIMKTEDTSFTDLWLEDGEYSYCITASYLDGVESEATEMCSINIISMSDELPLSEGFENDGINPEYWINEGFSINNYINDFLVKWEVDSTNTREILPYNGDYLLRIGTGPFDQEATNDDAEAMGNICSPIMDLSRFTDVQISFKYSIDGYKNLEPKPQNNFYLYGMNSIATDTLSNGTPIWDYLTRTELLVIDSIGPSQYTDGWDSVTISIPDSYLTNSVQFGFTGRVSNGSLYNLDQKLYLYYSIDDIVVSGTIKAEVPTGIQVSRGQGVTNVNWTAVQDATMYYIYRSDKPDVGYVEIGNTTSTSFNDPDTELEDGVYFYKVVSEVTEKILSPGKVPLNRMKEVSR